MKINMGIQSYTFYHTVNFQPITTSQSRDFNFRTLILQLLCRQTLLKNINWARFWRYKLGLLITWASKNWDISSLPWGECNSIVWALDESQDAFGKFPKTGTWKFLLGKVSKSDFSQKYGHKDVYKWIHHDLKTGILQEFLGHKIVVQFI